MATVTVTGAAGLTSLAPCAGTVAAVACFTTGKAEPGWLRTGEACSDVMGAAWSGPTAANTPPIPANTRTAARIAIFAPLASRFRSDMVGVPHFLPYIPSAKPTGSRRPPRSHPGYGRDTIGAAGTARDGQRRAGRQ
ncbi:hypothetical protein SAT01_36290 [Sinomonas atrocyanea]|nr:hypothetical protein SAT01_36290 [Sinomonas atrocyanea]GGG55599.1 hypothetical protein GCM10007172_03200 [Sinomonas atrocyanea]